VLNKTTAIDLATETDRNAERHFADAIAATFPVGAVLVIEAGGRMCDFDGSTDSLRTKQVIAGNARAAGETVALLRPHVKPEQ
jgi:fructose-1,6-bisphosphatase/inositol monophosphatase family enzyme